MRKLFKTMMLLCLAGSLKAQVNPPAIIPQPVSIINQAGYFTLSSPKAPVFLGFKSKPVHLIALTESLPAFKKAKLVLQLNTSLQLPEEGYKLSINSSGTRIIAGTEKGLFYGLQTLIQLLPEEGNRLPLVTIEDYPHYKYRGLHLDVSRHFFPVSFIKQYIDVIAQYKLNTFHWHLTDDQGWRIEIKKHPKLTSVGGYRSQSLVGKYNVKPEVYDGISHGGFYTQAEVKAVVAYAASKFVTVIPEIEMPGHALAALSAYPELACGDNPGPFTPRQTWGICPDVYCAGKEETFKLLEEVLTEVVPLFPAKYVHIGGDECPKDRWKTCRYCQQRIKAQGLKDEHELQSYFIQRIEKYLNGKGKQIIGWDEILEGGLAKNAVVMSWRGTKGGIAAAQQDHDVIMTPSPFLYLDHTESKSAEEPLTIGGYLPLSKVYSYNPTPTELTPAQQKRIIGVQANLWSEYISSPEKATYMLFPRVYALAEIAWTDPTKKNWNSFSEQRVPAHLGRLDRKGLMYHVPAPIGAKDTTLNSSNFVINYKAPVAGAKVYYTINGYTPYQTDLQLTVPVTLVLPAGEERTIKSVTITPTGKRSVTTTTVVRNK